MLTAVGAALVRFRFYRFLGRIHRLRRLSAALQRLRDRWSERTEAAPVPADEQIAAWLGEIRQHSHCPAPPLAAPTVAAIRRFARAQPCRQPGTPEHFRIGELRRGCSPGGTAIAVADVDAPLECPEVAQLAADPLLLSVASAFLGYHPRRTQTRLYWSPVSAVPEQSRRTAGQAIDFHYDIDACNAFYVYFYLVGGGVASGAHVVVEGSHGPKPWRMIVDSCFQPDQAVMQRYGADKVTVVTGGPGFGFFEDPACFHKALAPTRGPRLCLQLRYA